MTGAGKGAMQVAVKGGWDEDKEWVEEWVGGWTSR